MSSSPVHIKVRYIFVPLLELAVGFCVVYSALNRLLVALPGAAAFVILNLLIGAASPGIDNAAHLGGFVSGVLLGFVLLLPWAVRRQDPLGFEMDRRHET